MKADGQLWYLMINRERVGPITEDDVREKYAAREIGPRTYAWTPGQKKWERLFNIRELYSSDTLRGTGAHATVAPLESTSKFKETLPMPMLGDGDEGLPPAAPTDLDDELEEVDPHAVTTQWDPEEVEAVLREVDARAANAANTAPTILDPVDPEPEELVVAEPEAAEPELLEPKPKQLEDELAMLFGRSGPAPDHATGPKPRQTGPKPAVNPEPERESSVPAVKLEEPPVREPSAPAVKLEEPPVREPSSPAVKREVPADSEGDRLTDSDPLTAADPEPESTAQQLFGEDLDAPKEPQSRLLGQRSEDSVLFSRDQLTDLAQNLGYGSDDGNNENSLVDIKPLAADSLFDISGDDNEIKPLAVTAPASNILFPDEPPKRKSSLASMLLVSFLGILLAFGAIVGVLYLVSPNLIRAIVEGKLDQQLAGGARPGDPPVKAPAAPAAVAPATPATGDEPPKAEGEATDTVPARESAAPAARVRRPGKKWARHKSKGSGKLARAVPVDPARTSGEVKAKAPPPRTALRGTVPVAPAKKPAARAKGGDELDRLIDGALGGKEPAPKASPKKARPAPARAAAPPPSGNPLNREVVTMAMGLAESAVQACGKRHGKTGVVTIKVAISGSTGRIASGRAVGSHAGTALGSCVVNAARGKAYFPKFTGPVRKLNYAYILR